MGRAATAAKRTELTPLERIDPIRNIAGVCYEMEDQISHAIAIARTAQDRRMDDEEADCLEALGLILS